MKTFTLIIGFALNTVMAFAQNTVPNRPDSIIKNPKLKIAILKKADGALMRPTNDIAANITQSPEFSTFYKIIEITGLTETFKSQGPITVFAPANDAFAKWPAGKLDSLLMPDRKYDLIALATYHAIPGRITTKDIMHQINTNKGLATFITLTGSKLFVKLDANRSLVLVDENGGQSIISKFNVAQSNGLIHFVNAVLIPKFKNI